VLAGVGIALGFVLERLGKWVPVVSAAYWFVAMNLAFALGTLIFLLGTEKTFWPQPTRIGAKPTPLRIDSALREEVKS